MNEHQLRGAFFRKTGRVATIANIEYQAFLSGISVAEEQLAAKDGEYHAACGLVAKMHRAAMGEVVGPVLGVVEDVANVRQQLAEAQKQIVMLRDALHSISLCEFNSMSSRQEMGRLSRKALAATADLSGYILCDANPIIFSNWQTEPLYKARTK
jgi:hypothetical protein